MRPQGDAGEHLPLHRVMASSHLASMATYQSDLGASRLPAYHQPINSGISSYCEGIKRCPLQPQTLFPTGPGLRFPLALHMFLYRRECHQPAWTLAKQGLHPWYRFLAHCYAQPFQYGPMPAISRALRSSETVSLSGHSFVYSRIVVPGASSARTLLLEHCEGMPLWTAFHQANLQQLPHRPAFR